MATQTNQRFLKKEAVQGQAVVEYVIMVAVAVSLVAVMANGFKKAILPLWSYYFNQISAACPGCPPNPDYKFR